MKRACTIGLVHAVEVWPGSPGARRRAWVDGLLAASLTRSGSFEIVPMTDGAAGDGEHASDPAGFDAIALHLHGGMAAPVNCAIDHILERVGSGRLILIGDALVDPTEASRMASHGHLVLRGLPSPVWAGEISRWLDRGSSLPGGLLVEPVLPGWDVMPGGCFADPKSAATLLVRTALGVGARDAGCGVTAFEGPHRVRQLEAVAAEIARLVGSEVDRVEIVDPSPDLTGDTSHGGLNALLECGGTTTRWTLPVPAAPEGDAGVWRRLHAAGVTTLRASLPAACERQCEMVHSPAKPEAVGLALVAAREAGIETELTLQVGGPGETVDDRKEAAAWLRDHAEFIHSLVMRTYTPSPGSEMMTEPGRYGIWWPPGSRRSGWADRSGNNLVSREKHLWELVEVSRVLGIDVQTPGLTAVREVRRHRARVLQRYEVAAPAWANDPQPETVDDVVQGETEIITSEVTPRIASLTERAGPRMVEIELSAACNLRCVGCWCHSQLLSSDRHSELQRAAPLPTARITDLLDELATLGVREIQFSGSGEPLVNPDAVEIIGRASALGLRTTLVTNGTLLDPDLVEALGRAGLDQVTVSLWAGDADTYAATHPGSGAGVFDRVTSGLRGCAAVRQRLGRPLIKTYHVISRPNSGGLEAIVRHALDTDVDQVEFQVIDLVPDTVDDLSLSPAEVLEIEAAFKRLKKWPEYTTHWIGTPYLRGDAPPIVWEEFKDFGRFLRLHRFEGFSALEGAGLRCPRDLMNESVRELENETLELSFPERACRACTLSQRCFPDGLIGRLRIPTLKLTGTGSFLRRARAALSDPGAAEADLVRTMPCVVGDVYSRIDYRGNVVACCKGSSAPLGNVVDGTFLSVWSSPGYETFRRNAKTLNKDDPYFTTFGCLQSCDNLGMNLHALYTVGEKSENADDKR